MSTLTEAICHVAATDREINPDLRWGQAVFNAAYKLYPGEADQLRGGPLDPFYLDGLTELFLSALSELVKAT